jgi:hypothetical protein
MNINSYLSNHLMTFTYFLLLNLILFIIILNVIKCVTPICLQLILLPFCPLILRVPHNVYTPISLPLLALPFVSPLLVYLYRAPLPSFDLSLFLQLLYMLFCPLVIEVRVHTPLYRSPTLHLRHRPPPPVSLETSERGVV